MLTVFLTKSLKSSALKYWKYSWFALSLALLSIYFAFSVKPAAKFFFAFYYFCEYAFVYLLIVGCLNQSSGKKITTRSWLMVIPAILTATLLAFPFGDFNNIFNFHSAIMAMGFAVAFFALQPSSKFPLDSGWLVMKFALALLMFDFLHYTVIFSLRHTSYPQLLGKYLAYNSIIDLVVEILLGFGMVIVLFERVRQDIEETNHKLKEANDKLERVAHVDPLTAAFTRHAFYSFLQRYGKNGEPISGCVGVFDIDNLKPINDRFGHTVGDVAISTVARSIRSLVRADDLIFRWGGDEFFVVMIGLGTEQAEKRMCELNNVLSNINLLGVAEKLSIGVSYGFAGFNDINDLETSVNIADAEMYLAKQRNKRADKAAPVISVRAISSAYLMMLH